LENDLNKLWKSQLNMIKQNRISPNKMSWWCSAIIYIIRIWNCFDCVEVSGYPYYKNCNMANMTTLHILFFRQSTMLSLLMVSNSPMQPWSFSKGFYKIWQGPIMYIGHIHQNISINYNWKMIKTNYVCHNCNKRWFQEN